MTDREFRNLVENPISPIQRVNATDLVLTTVQEAAYRAFDIVNNHNPKCGTAYCNCTAINIIRQIYPTRDVTSTRATWCSIKDNNGTDREFAAAGLRDMFKAAVDLGRALTVDRGDIALTLESGYPVFCFGQWYGERRAGHVNTYIGYRETKKSDDTMDIKFLIADGGGTGDNCKRKVITENWAWRASHIKELEYYILLD